MKRLISNVNSVAAALAAAIFLGIGGCRHADLNRELVEREMRLQEDELYRLHDEVAERERLLASIKRENAVLKRELEQSRSGAPLPPAIIPSLPPAPTGPPPSRIPRGRDAPPAEFAPPLDIEVPGLEGPPPSGVQPGRSSWQSSRGVRPASYDESADQSTAPADESFANARVAKIVLNRRLTGGYNADDRLGDEGVMVVIEPRSEDDHVVKQPGDVSVVVVDPAASGKTSRVGRWDFSADEVVQHYRKTPLGEAIHLALRWPGEPPGRERLVVFARFTAANGEQHEASQAILVDLASDLAHRGAAVE